MKLAAGEPEAVLRMDAAHPCHGAATVPGVFKLVRSPCVVEYGKQVRYLCVNAIDVPAMMRALLRTLAQCLMPWWPHQSSAKRDLMRFIMPSPLLLYWWASSHFWP